MGNGKLEDDDIVVTENSEKIFYHCFQIIKTIAKIIELIRNAAQPQLNLKGVSEKM